MQPSQQAKMALVTGAAQGIGRATAERLAVDGFTVIVVDRSAEGAEVTSAAINGAGGHAVCEVVDLSRREERDSLVPRVLERYGALDVLVNNAAFTGRRVPFVEIAYEDWDLVIETNITATAFLCRAAGAHMARKGGGAIINVTSIQRRMPVHTFAPYVASKGAIAAFTRALAVELSPFGVRVNAVEPGVVMSPSFERTLGKMRETLGAKLPPLPTLLCRGGAPIEVAEVIAFLASEKASFMTGAIVPVDGGRSLSRLPDALDAGLRERAAGEAP